MTLDAKKSTSQVEAISVTYMNMYMKRMRIATLATSCQCLAAVKSDDDGNVKRLALRRCGERKDLPAMPLGSILAGERRDGPP